MILYAALGAAALSAAAFFFGIDVGQDREVAKAKKQDAIVAAAVEAANKSAADAIAKLKPRHTTIHQEVRREIETNTVYRDCRLTADGVRLADEALTGRPQRPGGRELPGAVPPVR